MAAARSDLESCSVSSSHGMPANTRAHQQPARHRTPPQSSAAQPRAASAGGRDKGGCLSGRQLQGLGSERKSRANTRAQGRRMHRGGDAPCPLACLGSRRGANLEGALGAPAPLAPLSLSSLWRSKFMAPRQPPGLPAAAPQPRPGEGWRRLPLGSSGGSGRPRAYSGRRAVSSRLSGPASAAEQTGAASSAVHPRWRRAATWLTGRRPQGGPRLPENLTAVQKPTSGTARPLRAQGGLPPTQDVLLEACRPRRALRARKKRRSGGWNAAMPGRGAAAAAEPSGRHCCGGADRLRHARPHACSSLPRAAPSAPRRGLQRRQEGEGRGTPRQGGRQGRRAGGRGARPARTSSQVHDQVRAGGQGKSTNIDGVRVQYISQVGSWRPRGTVAAPPPRRGAKICRAARRAGAGALSR